LSNHQPTPRQENFSIKPSPYLAHIFATGQVQTILEHLSGTAELSAGFAAHPFMPAGLSRAESFTTSLTAL